MDDNEVQQECFYNDGFATPCFCIGASRCKDEDCSLVKAYKESNGKQGNK